MGFLIGPVLVSDFVERAQTMSLRVFQFVGLILLLSAWIAFIVGMYFQNRQAFTIAAVGMIIGGALTTALNLKRSQSSGQSKPQTGGVAN